MRKIYLTLIAVLIGAVATFAASGEDVTVKFDATVFDFGTISSGNGPVTHVFEMTNEGTMPVAILSASTSCGCTRPEFPKKPVPAGETAKIKVSFLPEAQRGEIRRDIKLRLKSASGKSRRVTLKIEGVVVPEEK